MSAFILVSLRDCWFRRRTVESGAYFAPVGYLLTAMGWSLATAITANAATVGYSLLRLALEFRFEY